MAASDLLARLAQIDNMDPAEQTAVAIAVAEWLRDEATEHARVADEIATTPRAGHYYRAAAESIERLYRELRTEVLHA